MYQAPQSQPQPQRFQLPAVVGRSAIALGHTERSIVDIAEDADYDIEYKAKDLLGCKLIGDVLDRYYPGHAWMVKVSHAQGIAQVTIPTLCGKWSYVLHLLGLTPTAVMRAGGEILERCNMSRSNYSTEDYLVALHSKPLARRQRHGIIQI